MKNLESDRLILRKFTSDDIEGMYNNWATDSETVKYVTWDVHESIDVTKEVVNAWIKSYDEGAFNWVVEVKDTHEIIGNIDLVHINERSKTAEIGYCYGSKYWGKGYGTEALKLVINYLFNEEDFHLLEARHMSRNPASGKVMEKAGMKMDGVLRAREFDKNTNTWDDIVVYSIMKDEL